MDEDQDPDSPNETFHDTIDGEILTPKEEREPETLLGTELKKKKKKALNDLRTRLEDSLINYTLIGEKYKSNDHLRDIELWGVPLLPSRGQDRTDMILKKFLKAKDYNAQNALEMIGKTVMWREDFNVDKVFDEMFGPDLDNIGYIEGRDKAGHPLCYQMFEAFKDKDMLRNRLGSKDSCEQFLRWRIKLMERCVRKLDFKHDGADSVIQIIDVKNIPRQFLNEIFQGSKKYFSILQENYPGLIYRFVIVNVPMWFFAFYTLNMRLMTRKYKVMYVKPSAITETLLKFIEPEHLLAQYGGVGRIGGEFTPNDKVLEKKIKGYTTENIEIATSEVGLTVYWDVTVTGSDVTYKEEFVPEDEGSYNVLVQKGNQIGRMTSNSFHVNEPGKILISFANPTSKSRKIFYRYKLKPFQAMYTQPVQD
ncbi:putative CRAL-TRIO lipid binding domain, GOLD domain, CRAL/TRIO domain, CRAL/TRIO domain superfamily [Helianthus debilis subsp. tardiflorus]